MKRCLLWGMATVLAVACGGGPDEGAAAQDAGLDASDAMVDSAPDVSDAGQEAEDAEVAPACDIDAKRVYDDVALLAQADWGGRAPGDPGNEAAVAYAEELFTALGLTPAGLSGSFRYPFEHVVWKLDDIPSLTLGTTEAEPGTEFVVMRQSGGADLSAEVAFVGYGITVPPFDPSEYPGCPIDPSGYDDYAGVDVDGKIALMMRHGPGDLEAIHNNCPGSGSCPDKKCVWTFEYKAANARQHGAQAMLLVQHDPSAPEVFDAQMFPYGYDAAFPALFLDRRLAVEALPNLDAWVQQIDDTLQPSSVVTNAMASIRVSAGRRPVVIDNVIGLLPGTDTRFAEQVVLVGAHLDHLGTFPLMNKVYPGADDNASGSAVVMELARVLAECMPKPARPIAFALWNAEEDALVGSCRYTSAPTIPLEHTYAYLNVDMVGGGFGLGIEVAAARLWDRTWVFDVMAGAASAQGLNYKVLAGDAEGGSDHVCFHNEGVAAVSVTTLGAHAHYHTPEDTIENIVPSDLEAAGKLLMAAIQPFASGDEAQYFRCDGACRDQTYDACTCDVTDPCGWSNDGRCDDACAQVVQASFDESLDCPE